MIYKLHQGLIEIRHYLNCAGKDVFDDWLSGLADPRAQAKIAVRINRLAVGNFGDSKSLRRGVCELRIDWGRGYRVYYAMVGSSVFCYSAGATNARTPETSSLSAPTEAMRDTVIALGHVKLSQSPS